MKIKYIFAVLIIGWLMLVSLSSFTQAQVSGFVHVKDIGNMQFSGGTWAGTKGRGLRMEAFAFILAPGIPGVSLQYMCHIQDLGDTGWLDSNAACGTSGRRLRLEGFAVRLVGPEAGKYDVEYQAHIQDPIKDTPLCYNGGFAGMRGQNLRIEALRITIRRTDSPKPKTDCFRAVAPQPPAQPPAQKFEWCIHADVKLKASGERFNNHSAAVLADEDNEGSARRAWEQKYTYYEIVRVLSYQRGKCPDPPR